MTPRDVILLLMLKGYTFDEAVRVVETMAETAVRVSKAIDGIVEYMRRLQNDT